MPSPPDAQIRRLLEQQYRVVLFPHLTARLPQFAANPQRPHNPRSTTSPVNRLEEHSFLSSLCDEIGTVGDLQSVAASLGLKYSRVEQVLTSFPHDFPAAVFATLAGMVHRLPVHVLEEAG